MRYKNNKITTVFFVCFLLIVFFTVLGENGAVNLVKNPSFEEGDGELGWPKAIANWVMQREGGAEGSVKFTSEDAHSGKKSLLIENTNNKGYIHPCHGLIINPGLYIYRLWAKSDGPVNLNMQLYDVRTFSKTKPDTIQLTKSGIWSENISLPGAEWTKCEFVLPQITEKFPASIQIGLRGKGRLLLDDVEIVPGSESEMNEIKKAEKSTEKRAEKSTKRSGSDNVFLYDSMKSLSSGNEVIEKKGWKKISDRDYKLNGDMCLSNDYITLLFKKGRPAGELYYNLDDKLVKGPDFVPIGNNGDKSERIEEFNIIENYPDKVVIDVISLTADNKKLTVRYDLNKNTPFVNTEAKEGVKRILVNNNSQFAIVPDFFGNDLVVNAQKVTSPKLTLGGERILLEPVDNGNAIIVYVWPSDSQKVKMSWEGKAESRVINSTEIEYDNYWCGNVWMGILACPGIWHSKKISELDNMEGTKLDWKLPSLSVDWRILFRREQDSLIHCLPPSVKEKNGNWRYCLENGSRTAPGNIPYPAYIDNDNMYLVNAKLRDSLGKVFFPGVRDMTFAPDDVAIIYPFKGDSYAVWDALCGIVPDTPLHQFPEKMMPQYNGKNKFPATCTVTTDIFEKMFDKKEEKTKRRQLLAALKLENFFVVCIRERVEEYMSWMKEMLSFYEKTKTSNPNLKDIVEKMEQITLRINRVYHEGRGQYMETPIQCQELTNKVIALIDDDSIADKAEEAKKLGRAIRSIGGAQDQVEACMRVIVKELRQHAGYAMLYSKTDAEFNFANDVRTKTMEMLHHYFSHEGK